MMRVSSMMMLFAAALLTATACKQKEDRASGPPAAPAAPGAPPASSPSDEQIAAIVVAANQVDIDAGQLALAKSKHPEVRKFAERMVADHTAVNQAAVELVTRLEVTPQPSETSKSLATSGADTRAKLQELDGDAFDRAYVDNEVAYHEAVIGVLKTQLIPAATHPELKAALVGARPAFDAHLQHAKQIQAALAGGAAAAHDHGQP